MRINISFFRGIEPFLFQMVWSFLLQYMFSYTEMTGWIVSLPSFCKHGCRVHLGIDYD